MTDRESLCEALRQIAESIVDTSTEEGKTLLRAADEIERLLAEKEKLIDGSMAGLWKGCYDELRVQNQNLTARLIQQRRVIRGHEVRRREEAQRGN